MARSAKGIDQKDIESIYKAALASVVKVIPLPEWSIKPRGVELHSHHGKYGQATSAGMVQVYQGFLGTCAHNRLNQTIRHELAHLCIGLEHHHNRAFRRIEAAFGCCLDGLKDEEAEIQATIPYKWTVIAHLANGKSVDLGGVHRKTKRWSEYHNQKKYRDTLKGILVSRYEFIPNK